MLIKLKLGTALQMPTKRAIEQLNHAVHQLNRSKTHVELEWYRQQEGEKFKWLPSYKVGREVCREINSQLISSAFSEVQTRLKAKVPYNAVGNHRWTWQAILAHDEQLALHRGRSISINKKIWGLAWCGLYTGKCHNGLQQSSVSQSQCLFRISVWSKESGHEHSYLTFRVLTKKLSAGYKQILRQILDPDHYFEACDSRLSRKDDDWYLHLTYKDSRDLSKLKFHPESALTVQCNGGDQKSGFVAIRPNGSKRYFGPQQWLAEECRNYMSRRRWQQMIGPSGRGRQTRLKTQKAITRSKNYLLDRMRKLWIADIVKIAKQCGATGIHYREPSLGKGVRSHDWFATNGVNWDWTKFESDLRAKLASERIAYKVDRMKLGEFLGT